MIKWCPSRARKCTEVKQKRANGKVLFDLGIRFSKLAIAFLEPLTMASRTRAKHVIVMTDLFAM